MISANSSTMRSLRQRIFPFTTGINAIEFFLCKRSIMTLTRCAWANPANPRYLAYHDEEWGVPCHDETRLFELLNLEGAQAGLSWETILNKRDNYRAAFDGWDAEKIARYDAPKVALLLGDAGIVRNRL